MNKIICAIFLFMGLIVFSQEYSFVFHSDGKYFIYANGKTSELSKINSRYNVKKSEYIILPYRNMMYFTAFDESVFDYNKNDLAKKNEEFTANQIFNYYGLDMNNTRLYSYDMRTQEIKPVNQDYKIKPDDIFVKEEIMEWMKPASAGMTLLGTDEAGEKIFYYRNNSLFVFLPETATNQEVFLEDGKKTDYMYHMMVKDQYVILMFPGYEWVSAKMYVLDKNRLKSFQVPANDKFGVKGGSIEFSGSVGGEFMPLGFYENSVIISMSEMDDENPQLLSLSLGNGKLDQLNIKLSVKEGASEYAFICDNSIFKINSDDKLEMIQGDLSSRLFIDKKINQQKFFYDRKAKTCIYVNTSDELIYKNTEKQKEIIVKKISRGDNGRNPNLGSPLLLNIDFNKKYFKTKVNNLRMREKDDINGSVVRNLKTFEYFEVIGDGKNDVIDGIKGKWVKIRTLYSETGYCFNGYIEEKK